MKLRSHIYYDIKHRSDHKLYSPQDLRHSLETVLRRIMGFVTRLKGDICSEAFFHSCA